MNVFPRTPVDELKNNKKEIIFQITDWFVPESDRNQDKDEEGTKPQEYTVLIYGTNDEGNTICTKVINFKPFFYVKPPVSWEDLSDSVFEHKVNEIETKLREERYECKGKNGTYNKKIINKAYDDHLEPIEFIKKKDFWGFTNNKEFRFLKISVSSYYLYNNLKYYFQSDKVIKEGFKLYESNIDPFLKLIHIQKIKPCSWVKINKYSLRDAPDTTCDYNITANWTEIQPININKIAPLIVASFDIECTSSHGDFPLAIKNYKKLSQDLCYLAKAGLDDDKLIDNIYDAYSADVNISSSYKIHRLYTKRKVDNSVKEKLKLHEADIRFILNKIKVLDIPDNDDDDEDEDEEKPQRKITTKEINEIEESLNLKLTKILPELEGDKIIQIGTTVNRYGSDEIIYKNIISLNTCDDIEDTEVTSCKTEADLLLAWKRLMMKLNPDILIGYNIWGFDIEYIWNRCKETGILENFRVGLGRLRNRKSILTEQKLASSAMGENTLKLIDMDGVVCIDVFKVMQREYKLDSYKLDNVASIYIGENKDDLKPKEIFEKFKGNSADRCVIAKYCIQDCILINKLLHKLKILENNIGMGNVCLVPLNYLFRRGQGIKIFSLIGNECMKKGYLIPVIKNFISDEDIEGYEGAIVLDPKEGIYLDEPIVVFDYGSLYPSSMICRNLSHDTYILDKKYIKVEDPNIEIIKVSYDLYEGLGDKKTKVGVKDCLFAAYKDGKKGIIPEVLDMLLTERKNTRKKIEYSTITTNNNEIHIGFPEENDTSYTLINVDTKEKITILKKNIKSIQQTYSKFECDVFDALQAAYKITANSLYGQIGARTSPIYLKDIAACTTSTGREMIMIAKKFVEDNYNADVIYGDTDSIFCKFNIKDEEGNELYGKEALPYAIKIGKDIEKNIVSVLPYPQKLNYEKSLYPFILFSKKRYVGNLYETDVTKFKQKSMGIVLKRRDNANIVKKIYGGIIDIILNKQDLELSIKFLREELNDLVEGKADIKDLILSKNLRGFYKDPTKIAHKVLADRIGVRDPGNKPSVNDRIPYIYIKVKDAKLQGDKIENPDYIIENKLEPDYLHYITNQIMKPVLQLYALCLKDLNDYKEGEDYWDKVEEELKLKEMYKDDGRRKRRMDNLKLLKVQEILFDEFINKLKEPKLKKVREVKVKEIKEPKIKEVKEPKKAKETKSKKTTVEATTSEITSEPTPAGDKLLIGDIKIVDSKVKDGICYKIVIKKADKIIYKDEKEGIKNTTKDNVLKELLVDIYNKHKDNVIKITLNYKAFIKYYTSIKSKYAEFISLGEIDPKNNDIAITKLQKEIILNENMIKIKDNIILIE